MDHRPHPLNELDSRDILILVLTCIGVSIASCSGTGGGSLCIPILILFLHFNPTQAIPLGNITVLGGALTNLLFNIWRYHPVSTNRSLIDWDMIGMMEPATMLGALLGAYLHRIMSATLTVNLLVTLLTVVGIRMLSKGVYGVYMVSTRRRYENLADQHAAEMIQRFGSVASILADTETPEQYLPIDPSSDYENDGERSYQSEDSKEFNRFDPVPTSKEVDKVTLNEGNVIRHGLIETPFNINETVFPSSLVYTMLPSDGADSDRARTRPTFPMEELHMLIALFVGVCLLNILKAHLSSMLGISYHYSSLLRTAFNASIVLYIILFGHLLSRNIIARYKNILICTSPNSEIHWNYRNMMFYSSLCFIAGVMAGAFGIGGGIVKAPLMIEIGMHPQATAATSSGMVFFTSVVAATSYLIDQNLVPDYGMMMFSLGVAANLLAQVTIIPFVARYGQSSVITILLGLVISITAVLMIIEASREPNETYFNLAVR